MAHAIANTVREKGANAVASVTHPMERADIHASIAGIEDMKAHIHATRGQKETTASTAHKDVSAIVSTFAAVLPS